MINIKDTVYTVKAFLPSGKIVDITSILTNLSWSESEGELAQKATLTMANTITSMGYVNEFLKLCVHIYIYANEEEIMRGIVWDFDYSSSLQKEINITVYDKMIYAQKSKDNSYYSAGLSTNRIVADICKKWGIPLKYWWSNHTHPKTLYKNQAVSEHIISTLDEAAKKLGKTYVAAMSEDVLYIFKKGTNPDVYVFKATENTTSTTSRITMDDLVTKVIVTGKEDKENRAPIVSVKTGNTEYGILQEIVSMSDNDKLADAQKEAQEILNERGKPKEDMSISSVDVPFIRKGHKIRVDAGSLSDYFFVKSITHQANAKTMTAELERAW